MKKLRIKVKTPTRFRANEMAQGIKVLDTKPDNLIL